MTLIRNGQRILPVYNLSDTSVRSIQGFFDLEREYQKGHQVEIEYGFATSRTNNNLGNDPFASPDHWILLLNGERMSKYYGRNQTEELPTETIAANQIVTTDGVIGFTGTAGGDVSENGGVPITLVNISAVTDADPTASLANTGIPLPVGRHRIFAEFYGNQQPDDDVHIRMMQAVSGTDDIERLVGTQRQKNFISTAVNDVHAHYQMSRQFRLTAEATYYFQLLNYPTGANAQNRIVGYIQIERLA